MKALISLLFLIPSLAFADVSVPRAKQYLWTQYDVAVSGGQTAVSSRLVNLGAVLPAGAILTNAWVYINTQFAAVGRESLAFQCSGTRDLMDYVSMSVIAQQRLLSSRISGSSFDGSAALIPSSPTIDNVSAGFVTVPANCNVTAVIRGDNNQNAYTAGSATLILEYFRQ